MEDVSDNEINIPDEEELDMDSESVSENEILGDAASERELFPGLKSNYTMSSKEMDRKGSRFKQGNHIETSTIPAIRATQRKEHHHH